MKIFQNLIDVFNIILSYMFYIVVNLLQNALPLSSVSEQNTTSKKSQHSSQAMKKWHYFTKRRWQHQPLLLLFSYAPLCRISNGRHKTILTMKDLTQVATICQRGGGSVERDEKVYSLFTALAPHCCCKNKKKSTPARLHLA
jgi:hypothetical protein